MSLVCTPNHCAKFIGANFHMHNRQRSDNARNRLRSKGAECKVQLYSSHLERLLSR
jgi:hypothetical protein